MAVYGPNSLETEATEVLQKGFVRPDSVSLTHDSRYPDLWPQGL